MKETTWPSLRFVFKFIRISVERAFCAMMKECVMRVLFVAEPEMVEPTVTTSLA